MQISNAQFVMQVPRDFGAVWHIAPALDRSNRVIITCAYGVAVVQELPEHLHVTLIKDDPDGDSH